MSDSPPLHYDIFISHNNADREWASALANRLAEEHYNGRPLRPWLDRQYLDPGKLANNSELTTALDRSRILGLVLSPAALASEWVKFELSYFLEQRTPTDVIVMLRQSCELPKALAKLRVLDFRSERTFEKRFGKLVAALCPATEVDVDDVNERVDVAIEKSLGSDPGDFAPGPTRERDNVFQALVRYDIDDGAFEGLAIAAFVRAAEHVLRLHARRDRKAYNTKMLLGECLAAALVRSVGYRQVAQRLLDIGETQADPVLLFVVARAFSKLAEIDSQLVDTSVLLRLARQLDAKNVISNEQKSVETLLGRVLGKLRGTPAGDLLIKTVIEAGRSSRIAGIISISLTYHRGAPVFYVSELERAHERRDNEEELHRDPPSKRMLALLFASDLGQHQDVVEALRIAKQDIQHDFPGTELPHAYSWLGLRPGIAVKGTHLAPFMGIVVKATLDNMNKMGGKKNNVSTVACLTEPRIVEVLFQNCGALLIPEQNADSHQCRRLRGRGVPFAMLSKETMALIEDGDAIVVDEEEIRIWSRAYEPEWPIPKKRTRRRKKRAEVKPAKPRAIRGVKKLMREKIRPHLEVMASHVAAPLRLEIRIQSEGCTPSFWGADFQPGAVKLKEGQLDDIHVALHIDFKESAALLEQELSWDNIMKHVYGDLAYFSKLFDAWNAAVRERKGRSQPRRG
jgi:hypothetical protein